MMVGKIIQTFTPDCPIHRGDEKGYFLFGASASAIVFEKDYIKFDDDLIKNTKAGIETWVPLGSSVGDLTA